MGISQIPAQFKINGILNPSDTVLTNIEKMATSSGCWVTYNYHDGTFSVIINREGTSTMSFDDSNIIGAINVQSTGIDQYYNSVKVTFPRGDINDNIDSVQVDIPTAQRSTQEDDNILEMTLDMVNDPVQAELIGARELKQSRVDLVIQFSTDYRALELNAGDLIDITNDALGFTDKVFRVMTVTEVDDDDGSIRFEISALEYDATVYDNDLTRITRTNTNGIVTLGNVGTPSAPVLTLYERDSRPGVVVSATVPTGIVEGIEFWFSTNGTNYIIIDTKKPAGGGAFTAGATVDLDHDQLDGGQVYYKVRAINAQTTGAYSAVSTDTFVPVQIPDAVTNDTEIQDTSTGSLLTAAGLSTLMVLLDDLISDDSDASGGVFDKVFDVFNTTVGSDPRNPEQFLSANGGSPVVFAFQTNFFNINNAYSTTTTTDYDFTSFTAPYSGYYKVRYNANWGGTGGSDPLEAKSTQIKCNKTFVNQGTDLTATGGGSSKFEDHVVEGIFYAGVGNTVSLGVYVRHEYPTGTYSTSIGIQAEVSLFNYSLFTAVTMPDD